MAGIRLQPWVTDMVNLRMVFQESGHSHCIRAVRLHPDGQGLGPPQDKKAVKRAWNRADGVLKELELIEGGFIIGDNSAADNVGVSRQVFRCGMNHDVGIELERPLQERRCERIVYYDLDPMPMGDIAGVGDVTHREEWI
jgi:hypothetical protein